MKTFFCLQRFVWPFLFFVITACAAPDSNSRLVHEAGTTQDGFAMRRVVESNDCYSLQIDYPELNNSDIDGQIRSWVDEEYKSTTEKFDALCANVKPKQPFRLWVEYDLHSTTHTVAVVFESLIYAGGDQYHDRVDTLNFLWENGAGLDYDDIFAAPENLELLLGEYVRHSLAPELGYIWEENPEFASALESGNASFDKFAITRGGLTLYFPTRKLAPFYAGPQRCEVPLKRLNKFGPRPEIWE